MRLWPLLLMPVYLGSTDAAPRPDNAPLTLAVVNARVWTGVPRQPWADAIAVRGDRIALVGSSAAVRKLATADTR
ncbi:MAG TPA: hypothetical protein VF041_19525, partial [Gemmatimonadaceae bacterium]